MTTDGTYRYEYDDNGNRTLRYVDTDSSGTLNTGDTDITTYAWDYRNRLVTASDQATFGAAVAASVEYIYDAFNNRISKIVDADGDGTAESPVRTNFALLDGEVYLEFNGTTLTHRYMPGPSIDMNLAIEEMHSDGTTHGVLWALTDHQGTVRDVIDSTGAVTNHIQYNSFGHITSQTHGHVNYRFTYTGRELDAETGLHYYRARYYDSVNGRFISADPIGFNAGDANLYRYVGNNPGNGVDPTGMDEWEREIARRYQRSNCVEMSLDLYMNISRFIGADKAGDAEKAEEYRVIIEEAGVFDEEWPYVADPVYKRGPAQLLGPPTLERGHDDHGLTIWAGVPASDMPQELFAVWKYDESAMELLSPSVRYRWSRFPTGYTHVPIESGDGSEDSFIIVPSNFFADYSASTGDSAGTYLSAALGASAPVGLSNYKLTSFANMPRGPMIGKPLTPTNGPVTIGYIYQGKAAGEVYTGQAVSLKGRLKPGHHRSDIVISKNGKLTVRQVTGKISPEVARELTALKFKYRALGVREADAIGKSGKLGKPANPGKVGTPGNVKAWKKAHLTKQSKLMKVRWQANNAYVEREIPVPRGLRVLGGTVRVAGGVLILTGAIEHVAAERMAEKGQYYIYAPYTLRDARGEYKMIESGNLYHILRIESYYKEYLGGPYEGVQKKVSRTHGRAIRRLMHKKFGYTVFGIWVPGTERKSLPILNSDGSSPTS